MIEDVLYQNYQSALTAGRDGQTELAALYGPLRDICSRVIWITIRQKRPDLAGSVANKILQNISKFHGKSNFTTWAHRITVNAAIDDVRDRKREVNIDELESVPDKVQSDPYTRIFFQEVLESLDPDERELVLGRLHGEGHEVIAERLGVNYNTVCLRWRALKKKLRREFGNGKAHVLA